MKRQARPCGGRRDRVEAGETVRQARPCGGRLDRVKAGETVRRQARS